MNTSPAVAYRVSGCTTAACTGASPAVKQPQRRAAVATRGHVGLIVQSLAKIIDVEMLVMTHGGYERTEAEFAELFGRAGPRARGAYRVSGGGAGGGARLSRPRGVESRDGTRGGTG